MSGIGEASLVLSLVSSTIAIFEKAYDIYESANDINGLPKKIRSAADHIPLVHDALEQIKHNITMRSTTKEALNNITPILTQCERNASGVKDIFDKVIPAKDASRKERLKKAMGVSTKASQVKEYMEEILKSLQILAQNQVFHDAQTLEDINGAIEELNAPSGDEQPRFAHSGTGPLNVHTGGGVQTNHSNTGSGNQYVGQNQYFGQDQGKTIT